MKPKNNNLSDDIEKVIIKTLLWKTSKTHKLQHVAEEIELTRSSLSEFRRSGYLRKDKLEKLKIWLAKHYSVEESWEQILAFFITNFNKIKEPLASIIANANPNTSKIGNKNRTSNIDTSPDIAYLMSLDIKNFLEAFEAISVKAKDQCYQIFSQIVRIDSLSSGEEASDQYATKNSNPISVEYLSDYLEYKAEIEGYIHELNKKRPPVMGPIVVCSSVCPNCKKWTPSDGKLCMHCGSNEISKNNTKSNALCILPAKTTRFIETCGHTS